MKRVDNLFDKICNLNNISLAEKKARKGKTKKTYVIEFNKNRIENLIKVYLELKSGNYKPSRYTFFTIFESKSRKVSKSSYFDRIIHHSIISVLEPIFVDSLISQTYSSLKGRGLHKCLKNLNNSLKDEKNTKYTLKFDIKKFYESVNNELLIKFLERKFKDVRLLNLLKSTILSHKGLPLGSYTSQYFAHFYMNGLNHWLKETKRIRYLQVYGDDYVVLHSNKSYLHSLRREIQEYLRINLKLELSRFQVFPTNIRGIDFVGYVSRNTHILLRKSIKNKFKRMLRKYPNKESIASYYGWICHSDGINLWNSYLKGKYDRKYR